MRVENFVRKAFETRREAVGIALSLFRDIRPGSRQQAQAVASSASGDAGGHDGHEVSAENRDFSGTTALYPDRAEGGPRTARVEPVWARRLRARVQRSLSRADRHIHRAVDRAAARRGSARRIAQRPAHSVILPATKTRFVGAARGIGHLVVTIPSSGSPPRRRHQSPLDWSAARRNIVTLVKSRPITQT